MVRSRLNILPTVVTLGVLGVMAGLAKDRPAAARQLDDWARQKQLDEQASKIAQEITHPPTLAREKVIALLEAAPADAKRKALLKERYEAAHTELKARWKDF